MLIGIYALIFEFYSPGMIGPGVVGAICLLLALYAFQVLPVELRRPRAAAARHRPDGGRGVRRRFGVLGIGGVVAFVVGSIMLMRHDVPGFTVAWELIGSVALVLRR